MNQSSFINYNFENSFTNQASNNKNNYINLLYNVSYHWQTKKEWDYSLSFRKQIQRPNYSSLNPFKSISSDLIYFSGESQIVPAKLYSFNYFWSKIFHYIIMVFHVFIFTKHFNKSNNMCMYYYAMCN